MEDSVYKMIEVIGTSEKSWEDAAKVAISKANQSVRDIRIAEIVKLDMRLEDSRIVSYRARVKISFKYED
jgi:flavin-binding protein dodecin